MRFFLVPADNFITFFAVEISNVKIGFQLLCREKNSPIFKVKTEYWPDIPQRLEGRLFLNGLDAIWWA